MTETPAAASESATPLGATLGERATSFALFSSAAEAVELCLFDEHGESRVALEADDAVWRATVPGVGPGQRYGFRVHGPFDPARGLWCDPSKVLLDPYARAIAGHVTHLDGQLAAGSGVDSAPLVPRSVVVDEAFDWGDDDEIRPHHAWEDTVVYEVHVRGATMRHEGVPATLRGTYAGFGHDAFVSHLVALGVTTVELLPIHEIVDEPFLAHQGRTNYWGYNSIGFFAPAARYASSGESGAQVREFKAMVRALHRAGLEVVLDVVYNHTAEGEDGGPSLCFRGIDVPTYYRLDDACHLVDTTGCGNSINAASPVAIDLVVDSLRYWVSACHVDGFRFDLAPTLARPHGEFDPHAPIVARCIEDPVLSTTRLICEPWDVGAHDSFALGRFPSPFREWNGRFRDTVRDFWRSEDGTLAALATSVAGSTDLFESTGRPELSSINFVTSHDGFTLRDLVSYDEKHNEANGQDNTDGTNDNRSWNCGVEGGTADPAVLALRARQARVILATLVLSRGVPMLLGGDELGRTQQGNNNPYCQDNEMSWIDWDHVDEPMREFTSRLLALRREHPALRSPGSGDGASPLEWFSTEGAAMSDDDWEDTLSRCVAVRSAHHDDEAVLLVNGYWEPVTFIVPSSAGDRLVEALCTHDLARPQAVHRSGEKVEVPPRSIIVLLAARAGVGDVVQPR